VSDILTLEADPIAQLVARVAKDSSLPVPPPALQFCGDGDFLAIGAEFLGHFITMGGLAPHERVLDIGCGVGRTAVPLMRYLQPPGCYDGIDIVQSGIVWCRGAITRSNKAFRFHYIDILHPLYNPNGAQRATATRLPFADGVFDFICMVSLLTHLDRAQVAHYARETARLLAPGGRCFVTAFLVNQPAREALRAGKGKLRFSTFARGPTWRLNREIPLAGVAYDEDTFLELFLRVGLSRVHPTVYGRWSGRTSPVFQDLCVFGRAPSA
jgi:SAM-dependent methyltransferase